MSQRVIITFVVVAIFGATAFATSAPDFALKHLKSDKYEIVIRGHVASTLFDKLPVKAEALSLSPEQRQRYSTENVKTIKMMACTEFTTAKTPEADYTCATVLDRDGVMSAVQKTMDSGGAYTHARSETAGEGLRIFFGEEPAKRVFGFLNDSHPRDNIRSAGDISCTKDDHGDVLCAIDIGKTVDSDLNH